MRQKKNYWSIVPAVVLVSSVAVLPCSGMEAVEFDKLLVSAVCAGREGELDISLKLLDNLSSKLDAASAAEQKAIVLFEKGEIFKAQGRPEDARKSWNDSLAIRQKVLWPTHPDVIRTQSELAYDALARKDNQLALSFLQPEVESLTVLFGKTSGRLAEPLAQLCSVCKDDKELEPLLKQLIDIQSKSRKTKDKAAQSTFALAEVYKRAGNWAEAEKHFEKAIELKSQFVGPDGTIIGDGLMCDSYLNLGFMRLRQKKFDVADECFDRALAWTAKQPGPEMVLAERSHWVGVDYMFAGQLDKAMKMFNRSLALNVKLKANVDIAADYACLAFTNLKAGNTALAESFYKKAAETSKAPDSIVLAQPGEADYKKLLDWVHDQSRIAHGR